MCKEAIRTVSLLEPIKLKMNPQMMACSQDALVKANELLSFYSQYLPEDYFNDEEDESFDATQQEFEQFANKSLSAISGFFSKIKNTFEETKKPHNKKKEPIEEDEEFNTSTT